MILLPRSVKIFVATAPANLHRSFEGLSNGGPAACSRRTRSSGVTFSFS